MERHACQQVRHGNVQRDKLTSLEMKSVLYGSPTACGSSWGLSEIRRNVSEHGQVNHRFRITYPPSKVEQSRISAVTFQTLVRLLVLTVVFGSIECSLHLLLLILSVDLSLGFLHISKSLFWGLSFLFSLPAGDDIILILFFDFG